MNPMIAAAIALTLMIVLMAAGMPILFTFPISAVVGSLLVGNTAALLGAIERVPYDWGAHYTLVTIPMFTLMGILAFESGVTSDLYYAAYKWLGRLPGGLGLATIAAATGFAACTGSSSASAAAMGAMALPEMRRYGYDNKLATACVAMGGNSQS